MATFASFPPIDVWLGAAFLGAAAFRNWRYWTVPNALIAAFLLSFLPVALVLHIPNQELAARGAVFLAALLVCLPAFSLGWIGGGAAKLVAVTTLWLPSSSGILFCGLCGALAAVLLFGARLSGAEWVYLIGRHFVAGVAALGIALLVGSLL